jgi:hypothetical protein
VVLLGPTPLEDALSVDEVAGEALLIAPLVAEASVALVPDAVLSAVAPPDEALSVVVLPAVLWPSLPAPAAGRSGSVTSMYTAPADPGSPSTSEAAIHFCTSRLVSPK